MAHSQRLPTAALTVLRERRSTGGGRLIPVPYTNTSVLDKTQAISKAWRMAWERTNEIYPNRGQTLFPEAPNGAVYEITLTGTIRYSWPSYKPEINVRGSADALYNTTGTHYYDLEDTRKFEEQHEWLRINGKSIDASELCDRNGGRDSFGLKDDRAAHTYRLLLTDIPERLVIACEVNEGANDGSFSSSGYFAASVSAWVLEGEEPVVPPVTQAPTTNVVGANADELEPYFDDAKLGDELRQAVAKLHVEARFQRGWGDPEFQRRYAEARTDELLNQSGQIRDEARKRFHLPELAAYFEKHYPVGLRRLLGRVEALHIAETLSSKVDSRKPTTDEWRERQVRHVKTQMEDEAAKDLVAIEAELRRQDLFDRQEEAIRTRTDLTDEQKDRRVQAIRHVAAARLKPNGGDDAAEESNTPEIL